MRTEESITEWLDPLREVRDKGKESGGEAAVQNAYVWSQNRLEKPTPRRTGEKVPRVYRHCRSKRSYQKLAKGALWRRGGDSVLVVVSAAAAVFK